jgi:hypothetical protein
MTQISPAMKWSPEEQVCLCVCLSVYGSACVCVSLSLSLCVLIAILHPVSSLIVSSLTLGFIVAAPSGVCAILGVSRGGLNAIIGTAISASLLPPVVNCGVCLGLGTVHYMSGGSGIEDAGRMFSLGMVRRGRERRGRGRGEETKTNDNTLPPPLVFASISNIFVFMWLCVCVLSRQMSLVLWFINLVVIVLTGYLTFRCTDVPIMY